MKSNYLTPREVMKEYGIGRDVARKIISWVPNVPVGRKGRGIQYIAERATVEKLLEYSRETRQTLWQIVSQENNTAFISFQAEGENDE